MPSRQRRLSAPGGERIHKCFQDVPHRLPSVDAVDVALDPSHQCRLHGMCQPPLVQRAETIRVTVKMSQARHNSIAKLPAQKSPRKQGLHIPPAIDNQINMDA